MNDRDVRRWRAAADDTGPRPTIRHRILIAIWILFFAEVGMAALALLATFVYGAGSAIGSLAGPDGHETSDPSGIFFLIFIVCVALAIATWAIGLSKRDAPSSSVGDLDGDGSQSERDPTGVANAED